MPPSIRVRPATPEDAPAILEIAHAAWRATYRDRIGPEPVERFLAAAYTPERVARRIERHVVSVATAGEDEEAVRRVDAFVESLEEDGRAHIVALYARPDARGRGLGSALLEAVLAAHPGLDVTADVLVGNDLGEPFYVARGFEPGDLIVEEVGGESIRERRWRLRAAPTAGEAAPRRR